MNATTAAKNLTELIDILCQQIGDRNQTEPAVRIWRQKPSRICVVADTSKIAAK